MQAVEAVGREVDRDAPVPQPVGDLYGQQHLVLDQQHSHTDILPASAVWAIGDYTGVTGAVTVPSRAGCSTGPTEPEEIADEKEIPGRLPATTPAGHGGRLFAIG
ncbi:hypothetical protein Psi02_38400 [Planotetraspora silvatica]|uniref:Uncharacterized protein n=1 Tax=Planotetraspora silvatica TaxID=234614 RepID=A0A8J3UQ32_9ACTN|nr:hypothetical protein Psi02_38400 [Planotetraspora silvatica]